MKYIINYYTNNKTTNHQLIMTISKPLNIDYNIIDYNP